MAQEISQRALTDYLHAKASRTGIPLSGTFELSPICNFKCRMCYVRKSSKEVQKNDRIMTLEDWRKLAAEAREAGVLYLLLTGGEPLLWPDFWTLYDELVDMGFVISINSNGSLIDEEAVLHFLRKPPRRINITLYGASDDTYQHLCGIEGVFSKIDKNIRRLMEAGIVVKLNCSLTPENAKDLDWIIDYAKERDTVLSVATYMFPPIRRDEAMIGTNERFTSEECADYLLHYLYRNRDEEEFERYLQKILGGTAEPPGLSEECVDTVDGKMRCRAGRTSFWVTWDGWMTPCGMMPVPKIDIHSKKLADAWNEIKKMTKAIRLSGTCQSCPNARICHPCAAIAYAETGKWEGIPIYKCRTAIRLKENAERLVNKTLRRRRE